MKLTEKEIIKLKTKLALDGAGSKTRLAKELGCYTSQITLILDTNKCPTKYYKKLRRYMEG